MFEQYIGDGASTFITIIAVLIGFATALGYLDFLKTKKEHKKEAHQKSVSTSKASHEKKTASASKTKANKK